MVWRLKYVFILVVINVLILSVRAESNSIFSIINKDKASICTSSIAAVNKQTRSNKLLEIKQGNTQIFDNLSIKLLKCYRDKDVIGALIEVYENHIESDPNKIFHGWLIYPDQHVSLLSHPIYELLLTKIDH